MLTRLVTSRLVGPTVGFQQKAARRQHGAAVAWLRRRLATIASFETARPPPRDRVVLPLGVERGQLHDDSLLRAVFDRHREVGGSSSSGAGESVGLFGNRYLTAPSGFDTFAEQTISRAEQLVDRVLWAGTEAELRHVVRLLDRLSDQLCRLLDACEFIRWAHPSPDWCQAAAAAWYRVYQYMNQLNTSTTLYDQLVRAIGTPAVWDAWSEEERAVAQLLRSDFQKSAIHLPAAARARFVDLSQRISESGAAFLSGMRPEVADLRGSAADFAGLPAASHAAAASRITVRTSGQLAQDALRHVHSDRTRQAVYIASRTAAPSSVSLLEDLLRTRADLATLVGFQSYGHMILTDRMMAKSPAAVMQFLLALRDHNEPTLRAEMADLQSAKLRLQRATTANTTLTPPVHAWDKEYLMEQVRQAMRLAEPQKRPDKGSRNGRDEEEEQEAREDEEESGGSPYLSVGTVMQGLSRLFNRLFGVRFVPVAARPGEVWHPHVRRLDVVDDTGERIAVLYCDLYTRPGKSANPAHCTIRCSRQISEAELAETASAAASSSTARPSFASADEASNDGMATSRIAGLLWQLPTIVLTCDFSAPPPSPPSRRSFSRRWSGGEAGAAAGGTAARPSPPALLGFAEVETLFHEMGHAVHSILARTALQNVSGTRCASDFSELPSTLLERFATDPNALALFARHWHTDAPLPPALVARHTRLARRFDGLETANQIVLSVLDQVYHSPAAADQAFDTTALYHATHARLPAGPPEPPAVRWQGFFGHLYGYGSTYYSYLFDRVLADRIWSVVFAAGRHAAALDPVAGRRVKENLLRYGGGRDPWRCLADTLGDESVRGGDERAMAVVGGWGLGSLVPP